MWVHAIPGRARMRVPGLRRDPRRAAELERRLCGCVGIRAVSASPVTGTALIHYEPGILDLTHLALLVTGTAAAEVAAAAPLADAVAAQTAADMMPGLTTAEVAARRAALGPNLLPDPPRKPFLARLLAQYKDLMQLTLIAGAGLSYLSGHRRDALTIGALLLVNGVIGASQDHGDVRAVAALRNLTAQPVRVMRDGVEQWAAASDLVPGDLLLLEEGDRIPADAAVSVSVGLGVDESLLTGECAAVEKSAESPELAAGTCVVRGRGRAVVTATGPASTLGRIAALMEREERPAPLRLHLDRVARRAATAGLWLAAGVGLLGLLRGQGPLSALMAGTSLVISAIPEGLPAFVTLSLAAGAREMGRRNGTFQSLTAVEMMGTVSALCCDKTGTLTQGQMTITEVRLPDGVWEVSGQGYSPEGAFTRGGRAADPLRSPGLRRLLQAGALCNNARLGLGGDGALVTRGDPTELALLVAALKAGIRTCGGDGDRILEVPFDAATRRMLVVCRDGAGRAVACVKGAPEAILQGCAALCVQGAPQRLDARTRRRLAREAAEMAGRGLRVLAVAYQPVPTTATPREAERGLILLGLVGMTDPPRAEAAGTVERCRRAGVRVVMITGDHPATAAAVAGRTGISGALLTGGQVAAMGDAELDRAMAGVAVVARATPQEKLRVVRALRRTGHVVAMTGDGVNDAPAMREADVGIAMGDGGSEVARAAAGLVLQDDRLGTVVDAIEQGRATRRNIRATARYLLGSNAAEVALMAGALVLGLPLPLLPMQLLWLNLIGDGLPASTLGTQAPSADLMSRPPERPEALIGPSFTRDVAGHGIRTGLVATGLYAAALATGRSAGVARTMAMTALVASQVRHLSESATTGPSPQLRRAGAVTASLALGAIYLPPLRRLLQFEPLGLGELALSSSLALLRR